MKRTRPFAAFLIALSALSGLAACHSNFQDPAQTTPQTVEFTVDDATEAHTVPDTEGVTDTPVTDTLPADTQQAEVITSPAEPETQPLPEEEEREDISTKTPPKQVLLAPENTPVSFEYRDGYTTFTARALHIYDLYLIEYE